MFEGYEHGDYENMPVSAKEHNSSRSVRSLMYTSILINKAHYLAQGKAGRH